MSEVKVNKISPRTNCGTVQLGDSGDTITIPAGATITNNGTQTGFGRTGTVDWDTTAKTASFTAVSGNGYFVNTTSGAITVTLPAGSAGDIVGISDYASTFQTNNVTITPNGTDKINGENENATLSTQGIAVSLVYVDATRGWKSVTGSDNDTTGVPPYMEATGGTIVTCGNFKTHIFTGPGTFCVSRTAICAADNVVDYLVIAGGGGGSGACSPTSGGRGGGGAGGGRTFQSTPVTNPLTAPAGITITASPYPITVGGGGSAGPPCAPGGQGNNSIFSSITSAGGGYGSNHPVPAGQPGGSGGGGYATTPAGNGNVPPVSPPQGNPSTPIAASGGSGGGGWGAAAGGPGGTNQGGPGGAGSYVYDTFIGPTAPSYGEGGGPVCGARYFAGGGGGGGFNAAGGAGGLGGGGCGVNSYGPGGCGSPAIPGDANTGGGGGSVGAAGPCGTNGGAGGSGIVMIRYRYQ